MNKIKHVTTYLLLLMLISFVAQAQNKKLVFSNGQETDIQGNATININTGDITVQPVGDKLIVDEPASDTAIIGFYPSAYAIDQGDSINVHWAVAYTDNTNCTASVTQGAALWSGNKNGTKGTYVQTNVTVSQLPATLRLTCNDYNGASVFQDFDLIEAQSGGTTPTNPTINTFQLTAHPGANPTIPNDGNYTIQWSVSNLTGSCSATSTALNDGGWNGTRGASGSESVFIEGEPVLRLTCTNSGGSPVQRAITITNSGSGGGGVPANCAQVDIWNPAGLTASTWNYTDTYQGGLPLPPAQPGEDGFGNTFGHPNNMEVSMINYINPEQSYIVVSNMQVPTTDIDRKWEFSGSPGYGENGHSTISISECPGNFNPNTARCVMPLRATTDNILLSNRQSVANVMGSYSKFCHLEKGKTYYVNFVFAQPYDSTNFNGVTQGEECLQANGLSCSIFWGEKSWTPPGS